MYKILCHGDNKNVIQKIQNSSLVPKKKYRRRLFNVDCKGMSLVYTSYTIEKQYCKFLKFLLVHIQVILYFFF